MDSEEKERKVVASRSRRKQMCPSAAALLQRNDSIPSQAIRILSVNGLLPVVALLLLAGSVRICAGRGDDQLFLQPLRSYCDQNLLKLSALSANVAGTRNSTEVTVAFKHSTFSPPSVWRTFRSSKVFICM